MLNRAEKWTVVIIFGDTLFSSFFTINSGRFSEYDAWNAILFQMKFSDREGKEAMLVKYNIKETWPLSFRQERIIRRIKEFHYILKWIIIIIIIIIYYYYYYFYSYTRKRFYWVTFKLEDIHRPKFCAFFILHKLWKRWMLT